MCRFELDPCAFPHYDPISALIFLPGNTSLWKHCDEPKPWGRLSCGNLTVQHTIRTSIHEPALTADCKWCTAVLKMVATKSKEIQKNTCTELTRLEEKLNEDPELLKMRKDIEALEQQLANLRAELWETRIAKSIDGGSGEWEEVKAEL